MEKKNVTEVVIDGVIYRLGGYESSEYLQQVAGYLNNKTTELKALDGYHHLPTSQKALMMELNIADDYFKAKKSADHLEKELADKDKELYGVKHDLVALQMKLEEASRTIQTLKGEYEDSQKELLRLQAVSAPRDAGETTGQLPDKPEQDAGQQTEQLIDQTADCAAVKPESKPSAGEEGAEKSGITAGIREDEASDGQIPGQLSFDLPGGKEQAAPEPADEDPGAVFRPGNAAREDASSGEPAEAEDAENGHAKTFVPGAADRENMLRSARENFLNQSGSYSRKNRRRH
jgi:cell division protein ZapA